MSSVAQPEVGTDAGERPAATTGAAPDDAELARLLLAVDGGGADALARLYDRTAAAIYGFALWHTRSPDDAADILQEVFVRVARNRHRLAAVRHPRAWLLTIARRLATDAGRRRGRDAAEPIDEHPLLCAPDTDPAVAVDANRASRLVARLPRPQRLTVYLRHYVELSFAEIGRVAGVPTFTAASRYRLAIARLRRWLEEPR